MSGRRNGEPFQRFSALVLRPTPEYLSPMSLHFYSRVWLHLVWATLERRPVRRLAERYGLKWRNEETAKVVDSAPGAASTPLKRGVNETVRQSAQF